MCGFFRALMRNQTAMKQAELIPKSMTLRFDPQCTTRRPWSTVGEHVYRDAVSTKVVVPDGFTTDLASIPTWLAWLYCPFGRHQMACLFHDWLYETQDVERFQADAILRVIMEHSGVKRWRVLSIYWAVRLFGGLAWHDISKKRKDWL